MFVFENLNTIIKVHLKLETIDKSTLVENK